MLAILNTDVFGVQFEGKYEGKTKLTRIPPEIFMLNLPNLLNIILKTDYVYLLIKDEQAKPYFLLKKSKV